MSAPQWKPGKVYVWNFLDSAPPDEPRGLGAVVEASAHTPTARLFVRIEGDESPWTDDGGVGHEWSELEQPRVLSEGWSE